MAVCVRTGCGHAALASWWALCVRCTAPLLEPVADDVAAGAVADQQAAAGWDALAWAERIAPQHWGNADLGDAWVTVVRCLAVASVVTGRAEGCTHTRSASATPVVAVPRATGTLRCPTCAEAVVAATTTDGHACDRCSALPVTASDRVAVVAGASLIVVAQLCGGCRAVVLAWRDPLMEVP